MLRAKLSREVDLYRFIAISAVVLKMKEEVNIYLDTYIK